MRDTSLPVYGFSAPICGKCVMDISCVLCHVKKDASQSRSTHYQGLRYDGTHRNAVLGPSNSAIIAFRGPNERLSWLERKFHGPQQLGLGE